MKKKPYLLTLERSSLHTCLTYLFVVVALPCIASASPLIYATGQVYYENGPGTADDVRENWLYSIDTQTGHATEVAPWSTFPPTGLGGTSEGDLLAFTGGQLGEITPTVGDSFTPIGGGSGVNAFGYDVLNDGRSFVLTSSGSQVYEVDRITGAASAVGATGQIGAAFDSAFGLTPGTSSPSILSVGSVGDTLYGINTEVGRQNLFAVNPDTGATMVIGAADAVDANDSGNYSGYVSLTGVDENGDGEFDALYGGVNFWDDDGSVSTPDQRLGGVARFDLDAGTWSLAGTNPGVIFFAFGSSPAPEPSAFALLGFVGCTGMTVRMRRRFGKEASLP